jgi:MerR family transcriptional regulator/heat shock protein HspR
MTIPYPSHDEPCYVISVAAKMVGLNAQALRYYERTGLVKPSRTEGNLRLYSLRDVERLRRIKTLVGDLGVNLAGVEVVLRLMEQLQQMESLLQEMRSELQHLRAPQLPKP